MSTGAAAETAAQLPFRADPAAPYVAAAACSGVRPATLFGLSAGAGNAAAAAVEKPQQSV